jgi:hypothetical protein
MRISMTKPMRQLNQWEVIHQRLIDFSNEEQVFYSSTHASYDWDKFEYKLVPKDASVYVKKKVKDVNNLKDEIRFMVPYTDGRVSYVFHKSDMTLLPAKRTETTYAMDCRYL